MDRPPRTSHAVPPQSPKEETLEKGSEILGRCSGRGMERHAPEAKAASSFFIALGGLELHNQRSLCRRSARGERLQRSLYRPAGDDYAVGRALPDRERLGSYPGFNRVRIRGARSCKEQFQLLVDARPMAEDISTLRSVLRITPAQRRKFV